MKIAVTYDNGNIFQHFGRTESFKIYEIEDGKVVLSEVLGTDGIGHSALADMLADMGVDTLICGGMGGGAKAALSNAGITVYAGASGDCDKAVEDLLKGELEQSDAECDHHHEEGHSCGEGGCGHHEEEGCGHHEDDEEGGCGHSCGGCGRHAEPDFTGKNVGKVVRVHYRGTLNDGSQFDSSYDRGEPLEFTCGAGQMIKGFDKAVADMEVGEIKDIHLMPEEAYGMPNPSAILTVEIAELPGAEKFSVGDRAYLSNAYGQPIPVKVTAKDEKTITFDANHEMAGKELNFKVELVEVKQ